MSQKRSKFDFIVVGFALFAVFFGAGNLIFPPYLGLESGTKWFPALTAFVVADAGLAIMTVLAIVRLGTDHDLLGRLPKRVGLLCMDIVMAIVGPVLCIPRTCATTFEMGAHVLFPNLSSWIFGLLFFAVVAVLTIRPGKVVDIVGKYLTPMLLITIAVLCIKGLATPIGDIVSPQPDFQTLKEGFLNGYQTMDVLGALAITIVIMKTVQDKGYNDKRSQMRVIGRAGIVAGIALFLVYGGLAYLGATTSNMKLSSEIGHTELVVLVTFLLLRRFGVVLLALIVFFACLTTAVGLVSSASTYFSERLKGRVSYTALVLVICVFGMLISNVGISTMISLASPMLSVLYPLLLTQVFLSFFSEKIKKNGVFIGAAVGAVIPMLLDVAYGFGLPFGFITKLPLYSLGFVWVIPAVIGGLIGAMIPEKTQVRTAPVLAGTPDPTAREAS
ncbi:MAG: branched-chain amino acid transport system II carrier protein [Lachnospiraceae bacterium]|nr:branched-chain amino acid transport system II carrier protein [Lachnospiraceae bacterium]